MLACSHKVVGGGSTLNFLKHQPGGPQTSFFLGGFFLSTISPRSTVSHTQYPLSLTQKFTAKKKNTESTLPKMYLHELDVEQLKRLSRVDPPPHRTVRVQEGAVMRDVPPDFAELPAPVSPSSFRAPRRYSNIAGSSGSAVRECIATIRAPPASDVSMAGGLPPRLGLNIATLAPEVLCLPKAVPARPLPVSPRSVTHPPVKATSYSNVLSPIRDVDDVLDALEMQEKIRFQKEEAALRRPSVITAAPPSLAWRTTISPVIQSEVVAPEKANERESEAPSPPKPGSLTATSGGDAVHIATVVKPAAVPLGLQFISQAPLVLEGVQQGSPAEMSGVGVYAGRILVSVNETEVFLVPHVRSAAEGKVQVELKFSEAVVHPVQVHAPLTSPVMEERRVAQGYPLMTPSGSEAVSLSSVADVMSVVSQEFAVPAELAEEERVERGSIVDMASASFTSVMVACVADLRSVDLPRYSGRSASGASTQGTKWVRRVEGNEVKWTN